MAYHGAVGRAGEPTVGHQRHRVAEALPDERAGDGQHLAHSRAALGPFVADHHDVARLDLAALYGLEGRLLLLEDPGGSFVDALLVSGNLDYGAFRSDVAAQDGQAARGAARRVGGVDHRLVVDDCSLVDVLRQGLAVDRHAIAVQEAGVQQALPDQGDAAVAAQVGHHIAAARLHVGDVRRVPADAVEVLQRQVNLRLPRDGHQVQHRVGGASHGDHHGDRVFEGLPGQDVPRADAFFQHPHHRLAGAARLVVLFGVDGGQRGIARQGQPHHLDGRGHGVGGEQAGTGTLARAGVALQLGELLAGHAAGGVRAHGLKHVLDVDVAALELTGHDAAAIHENGGDVQAGDGHHAARHVLVAPGHRDQAVHALAEGNGLDGVGDDLTTHQRGLHSLGAHGNAVADGDGAELEGRALTYTDTLLDRGGDPVQVHVAGRNVAGQVGDGDERLVQVLVRQAHGHEHGTGRRPFGTVGDVAAAVLEQGSRAACGTSQNGLLNGTETRRQRSNASLDYRLALR